MSKLSLKPSDFITGGGVPSDRNLNIVSAEFTYWDYNGQTAAITALKVAYTDDDGAEYTQYYSAGSPDRLKPSSDGKSLESVGDANGLTSHSNCSIFLESLVEAGFPENKLADDISIINGLRIYSVAKEQPKRAGMKGKPGDTKVVLVVSKIFKMPWDKKQKAEVVTEAVESEYVAKAAAIIARLAAAAGGSIGLPKIGAAIYTDPEILADPDHEKIAEVAFSNEVKVALLAYGFTFEGTNYLASK